MKKTLLISLSIVAAFILMSVIWGVAVNNSAIKAEEQIFESKSSIDIQVKKRNDTILLLVQVVEQYDAHEAAIIKAVTDARAALANNDISAATTELKVILEAYPDIKSAANYNTLMLTIAQCENSIATHRDAYNIQVKDYKKHVRTFPNAMFLSIGGYEVIAVDYLELSEDNNLDVTNIFGS